MIVFNPGGNTIEINRRNGETQSVELGGSGDILQILHQSTACSPAYIKAGSGAQTATANDFPVLGQGGTGGVNVGYLRIANNSNTVSAHIPSSSDSRVFITRGTAHLGVGL